MSSSQPSTLIDGIALLTRLQGDPLSANALSAQTLRNAEGRPDLQSLREVLLSHGYDNQLSQRPLDQVPALAVPVLLLTQDGGAVVATDISGHGADRRYTLMREDGGTDLVG